MFWKVQFKLKVLMLVGHCLHLLNMLSTFENVCDFPLILIQWNKIKLHVFVQINCYSLNLKITVWSTGLLDCLLLYLFIFLVYIFKEALLYFHFYSLESKYKAMDLYWRLTEIKIWLSDLVLTRLFKGLLCMSFQF